MRHRGGWVLVALALSLSGCGDDASDGAGLGGESAAGPGGGGLGGGGLGGGGLGGGGRGGDGGSGAGGAGGLAGGGQGGVAGSAGAGGSQGGTGGVGGLGGSGGQGGGGGIAGSGGQGGDAGQGGVGGQGGGGSCTPDCAAAECGPDGCGGVCGLCPSGAACDLAAGSCEPFCGNSCGASCGACPSNSSQTLTCTPAGLCKCNATCAPSCTGKACGDDGCGGSCGGCPSDQVCTFVPGAPTPWTCQPFAGTSPAMTFFVTSRGTGALGGNLGGLAGADARCEQMALEVGVVGKTWRAYLSTSAVDARDRIGIGPWLDARGVAIVPPGCAMASSCVDDLHQDGIPPEQVLTERGTQLDWANAHDIMTGSTAMGTSSGDDCQGWTSSSELDSVTVGHSNDQDSWNASHATKCDQVGLQCTAGQGNLYCFAE